MGALDFKVNTSKRVSSIGNFKTRESLRISVFESIPIKKEC